MAPQRLRHVPYDRLPNSRGAVLVAVVVCLGVVSTMLMAMAQATLHSSFQAQRWTDQAQAMWLAEAALEKAARHLRTNPEYRGEVITLSVAPHDIPAEVTITVDRKDSATYRVTAVARYPAKSVTAIQFTKSLEIDT